jgi:hypothetical protein
MSFLYNTSVLILLNRIRYLSGIDKAVFYSIISKALSTAGSLITVPLILTRLSSVEQGYYYTFGSILSLQVFLEMGFGTVVIQMVAHEAAHLKIDLNSGISGSDLYLNRFSAIVRFVRNWYLVVSFLVGILLFPAGFWFFATSSKGLSVSWLGPWVIMAFATAGGVFVNSLSSIVEGMGFVAESVSVRLWGGAAQILITIAGLLAGFRLYAASLGSFIALLINFALVRLLLRNVMTETSIHGKDFHVDWVQDVLPFQWRIALGWMSGWFIFNAMMPVVFRQLGPEEAGRYGLAMSVSNFINAFALNWTSTKSAIWGQMASRKEWKSMDSLFWKVTPLAVGIATIASIMALLLVPRLGEWIPRFSGRVPEWRVLFMLCSVTVMNQIVFAEAFYLRGHKREPFLVNSVVFGVAMAVGLFCFQHVSAFSVSAMYAFFTSVTLIWATIVFLYCRSRWHYPVLVSIDASKNER